MLKKIMSCCQNLFFLLILCYAIENVSSRCDNGNQSEKCKNKNSSSGIQTSDNGLGQNGLFGASDACETTIIFDISQNTVTKEIFDVSIRYFLQSISKHCNTFKYVIIRDKFDQECESQNGCKVNFYNCEDSCNDIIDNMDYNNFTSTYPTDLMDVENSKNYLKYLDTTFSKIKNQCESNPVFLLTNRIVFFNEDAGIIQTMKDSSIKLTTILLGKNDTNATLLLDDAFQNIPNVTTLNFVNYDCLSYLFYCLLPCSSDAQKCMPDDVGDCQYRSKWTPNYYPNRTLHVWYVYAFNNPFTNFSYYDLLFSLQKGFKDYIKAHDIKRYRIRVVTNDYVITSSLEDIDDVGNLFIWQTGVNGDVVDDENEFNLRLSLVPCSGTLTESRIGINSVIIFTNYASITLKTTINGQQLQGQMHVYNLKSYTYYDEKLKNDTNFVFYKSFYNEYIYINPNDSTLTTTTTSVTHLPKTTTTIFSTLKQSSSTIKPQHSSALYSVTAASTMSISTTTPTSSAPFISFCRTFFSLFYFIVFSLFALIN